MNSPLSRDDLTQLWADISKCYQRAANQTIPSIIVNEDTTIAKYEHFKIRDRMTWTHHEIIKDMNWLRNTIKKCAEHTDSHIQPPVIIETNITIVKINSKYKTDISYINNNWERNWLTNTKRELRTIKVHLRKEELRSNELQIKSAVEKRNSQIDGGKKSSYHHY